MVEQVNQGHEVCLIYPGKFSVLPTTRIIKNADFKQVNVFEIVNPLPVSLLNGIKDTERFMQSASEETFQKFLRRLNPEVIHVHSFMGLHKEFLDAAKRLSIKLVFTSHDYFGLCPKVNLFNSQCNLCNDFNNGLECTLCNDSAFSFKLILLMQSKIYRNFKESTLVKSLRKVKKNQVQEKEEVQEYISSSPNIVDNNLSESYVNLRKYYISMFSMIDKFHFNSSTAQSVFEKYLGTVNCECIPVTHSEITENRRVKSFHDDRPLRVTYMGPMESYKGFFLLESSLNLLLDKGQKFWVLNVYGDNKDSVRLPKEHYKIHGKYNYQSLSAIFEKTDLLVVPSLWKETFGLIGLEALAYGIPIIVSENVGVKDVIDDGETGVIFNGGTEELACKMDTLINDREILKQINSNIIESEFCFSMRDHSSHIVEFYCR